MYQILLIVCCDPITKLCAAPKAGTPSLYRVEQNSATHPEQQSSCNYVVGTLGRGHACQAKVIDSWEITCSKAQWVHNSNSAKNCSHDQIDMKHKRP